MKPNWHRIFGIVVMVVIALRLVGELNAPAPSINRLLILIGALVLVVAVEAYAWAHDLW